MGYTVTFLSGKTIMGMLPRHRDILEMLVGRHGRIVHVSGRRVLARMSAQAAYI